ncbi:hypothetical protein NL676_021112 [Syzygium grande]|nr:hypothetical protein NL676_021112 [Syzygium grande]
MAVAPSLVGQRPWPIGSSAPQRAPVTLARFGRGSSTLPVLARATRPSPSISNPVGHGCHPTGDGVAATGKGGLYLEFL